MTRLLPVAVAARLALVAMLTAMALMPIRPLRAEDMRAEGEMAVEAWINAVVSGDRERIAAILAPEFKIQRPDGSAYDKAGYLASELPRFPEVPEMSGLVVTGDGGLLVARYVLTTGGVLPDESEERKAPRLTVFRRDGDMWLVVSHANFAPVKR